ncbi:MAG TPA: 50S ribosomal protein L11 methyltransferase [Alphaproteobacteria bacterium]|nr:50S ribosomal protein L11 methyltransferase [Alphaproteobacteria bacterium]
MTEEEFIRQQTLVTTASAVPEIPLYLATEVTPLWQMTEERLKQNGLPPPYWAFAWPGGQGVARYILENPDLVQGKRIIDFAAGCGIAAIAAMKADAKSATAIEIDPMALAAIKLNAAQNNVEVISQDGIDMEKAVKNIDIIFAGDVCYQQAMSAKMMRWLWRCVAKGTRVFLADPGRAYVPHDGLEKRGEYVIPTSRDLEDRDSRTVIIWEVFVPKEED